MHRLVFNLLCLLAACGRPLTSGEAQFAEKFHGPGLDISQVRITRSPFVGLYKTTAPVPPRTTCAQKLFPPTPQKVWTGAPAATVLFNTIHVNDQFYSQDYLRAYPEAANLLGTMFLAHELVHAWQWQNRATTGYHPLKAAAEHQALPDPYLFDLDTKTAFGAFGYEQQGAIASEYVCCAALAPDAARTKRLNALLADVFPIERLTRTLPETNFPLPWPEADLKTICA